MDVSRVIGIYIDQLEQMFCQLMDITFSTGFDMGLENPSRIKIVHTSTNIDSFGDVECSWNAGDVERCRLSSHHHDRGGFRIFFYLPVETEQMPILPMDFVENVEKFCHPVILSTFSAKYVLEDFYAMVTPVNATGHHPKRLNFVFGFKCDF